MIAENRMATASASHPSRGMGARVKIPQTRFYKVEVKFAPLMGAGVEISGRSGGNARIAVALRVGCEN